MAGRHNPSSVRRDRLQSLAEERRVNVDSRQSPVTKNHKDSSNRHQPHQTTKEEAERAEEHKCEIGTTKEK